MLRSSNSTRRAMTARAPASVAGVGRGVRPGRRLPIDPYNRPSTQPPPPPMRRYAGHRLGALGYGRRERRLLFVRLFPRLVDATAYVARAAERHVCAASSKCYGSQTVESGKAIRPGMTGFPRRIFVSQCSADVSTYRCRSVVIFSSVAKPSDRTCSISLTKKPQLPRIAQALIDALRARALPARFRQSRCGRSGETPSVMRGASLSSCRTRLRSISSVLVVRSPPKPHLEPGFDREGLDEVSAVGDVLINSPRIGAVAPSRVSKLVDRAQELGPIVGAGRDIRLRRRPAPGCSRPSGRQWARASA